MLLLKDVLCLVKDGIEEVEEKIGDDVVISENINDKNKKGSDGKWWSILGKGEVEFWGLVDEMFGGKYVLGGIRRMDMDLMFDSCEIGIKFGKMVSERFKLKVISKRFGSKYMVSISLKGWFMEF